MRRVMRFLMAEKMPPPMLDCFVSFGFDCFSGEVDFDFDCSFGEADFDFSFADVVLAAVLGCPFAVVGLVAGLRGAFVVDDFAADFASSFEVGDFATGLEFDFTKVVFGGLTRDTTGVLDRGAVDDLVRAADFACTRFGVMVCVTVRLSGLA